MQNFKSISFKMAGLQGWAESALPMCALSKGPRGIE